MKRLIIAAMMAIMAVAGASAQMQAGEKSFGPKLGYVTHNKSAVAGLVFRYAITDMLRIAPEIGCAFRNEQEDAFLADINLHVPFRLVEAEKASLYPIAGVTFNSWSMHGLKTIDDVDVTTHTNRFGLNLGAGFDLRCSPTLLLNIEGKYSFVKSFSAVYITAGISYIF